MFEKKKKKAAAGSGFLGFTAVAVIFGILAITLGACTQEPEKTQTAPVIDMVRIPAGVFTLGKELGTKGGGYHGNTPTSVALSGYRIGKYQVTQDQWRAVMGDNVNLINPNPSYFSSNPASGEVQGRRPVESVSWYEALVFCNRLSIKKGLRPAYWINGSTDPAEWGAVPMSNSSEWNEVRVDPTSTGYRLPTEAQWEYAAKGGANQGAFTYSGSNDVNAVGWYDYNTVSQETHEVGKKQANELGLYDMSGNVNEWCWDRHGNYMSKTDPDGPSSGSYRVLRGGSSIGDIVFLQVVCRNYGSPIDRGGDIGFRVALP